MKLMEESKRTQLFCDFLVMGTIVTMDDNNTVIEDGAVAVSGDSIAAVGPAADLEKQFCAKEIIELARGVVMPGLINAHAQIIPPQESQQGSISQEVVSPEESMGYDEDVCRVGFRAITQ